MSNMTNVVRLFDGEKTLKALSNETIKILHHTNAVIAIKKLLRIHDILDLNILIQQQFKAQEWDIPALKDLNVTRAELIVFHHIDFDPYEKIYLYNNKLCSFLKHLAHKFERDDLLPITNL